MGYSEKFWTSTEPLAEAETAALAQQAFAAAGFGQAAPVPDECSLQAAGPIALPLANPDAGAIYPEHFAGFCRLAGRRGHGENTLLIWARRYRLHSPARVRANLRVL